MLSKLKDQRLIFAIIVLWMVLQTILTLFGHRQLDGDVLKVLSAQSAQSCQLAKP
jgi:purine-cytosine permease-like protein